MSDVLTVAQLVSRVKHLLESNFRNFSLEGEVSNLSRSATGHWYFTLSDESSSVSAALFKGDAMRNPFIQQLKDGDKVVVAGSVSVYPKRGTFQVIVKKIIPAGQGDLKLRYEQMKAKLASEGLFDTEAKKEIPAFPQKIAVITAEKAAALQDFLNVYSRRSFYGHIVVIPALVQGDASPQSLRKALFAAQKYNLEQEDSSEHIDLIVFTRGGGSMEDLWAFNDEGLAYDIYNCDIPVISAVGHQVDFSISDFVADLRCETPTAAAEVITQPQREIIQELTHIQSMLINVSRNILPSYKHSLSENDPMKAMMQVQKRVSDLKHRLANIDFKNRAEEFTGWRDSQIYLEDLVERATACLKEKHLEYSNKIEKFSELIEALGPKNVLSRGYSYVIGEDGKVVSSLDKFHKVKKGSRLGITFYDGRAEVLKE